ncbi:hypothetical protein ACOSQ2_028693 [Xanthoceras sorbifolium]
MVAKSLNFNFPIKLTRDNYVYWKTLVLPSIRALELEELITGERLCPNKFVHVTNLESSVSDVQQLQVLKKGSSSIVDFILQIKGIGDGLRSVREVVTDRDLLLNVLNGLGYDFDPVVVIQCTMTLHKAQYMLMIHEQRIEHLNSAGQIDVPQPTANFVANANNGGRSGGRGGPNQNNGGRGLNNRGRRGRGGRWNTSNNISSCQICGRNGHSASYCYN